MRRARHLLLVATALGVVACTGEAGDGAVPSTARPATSPDGSVAAEPASPASPAPSSIPAATTPGGVLAPAPAGVTAQPDGVRTYGGGRALLASYDPASDRTVIATTIDIVTATGNDPPKMLAGSNATHLAASVDGSRVAAIMANGTLSAWEVATRTPIADIPLPPVGDSTTLHVASPDTVVVGDRERVTVYGLDEETRDVLAEPIRDGGPLGTVTVGTGGTVAVPVAAVTPLVVTWTPGGSIATVDPGLGEGGRLTGAVPSPDGTHLAILGATAAGGDELRIWDLGAGRAVGRPLPLANYVTPAQLAFPTADRIVLPLTDRVAAFDLTGTEIASTPRTGSPVATIQSAGDAVVVTSADGTAARWVPGAAATMLGATTGPLVDQRTSGGIATVDQRGLVRSYGADGTLHHELDDFAVGEVTSVGSTADGATLAIATSNGAVRLIDAATGVAVGAFDRPEGAVTDVALSPDDSVLATGVAAQRRAEAWDDTIEANRLDDGTALFALGGQSEDVAGCAFYDGHVRFSPDGTLLASSSHDFTVQITALADPDATTLLSPHLGTVYDLQFSPDGRTLVTSADDGSLRVWRVDGWDLLGEHRATAGAYTSMAFAPDGALAASTTTGEISIVDPATGVPARTFGGSRAILGSMAFAPDGRRLYAPLDGGAIGVWDVAGGELVDELPGHTQAVTAIAVSPDGTKLLTSSRDGTVRTWPLPAA